MRPHPEPWQGLRRFTAARIALGRSGGSLPTGEVLSFGHDQALARDAVHAPFDGVELKHKLAALHPSVLLLESAAPDRASYLRRPDLGRQLSASSVAHLSPLRPEPDLVIIVSDGLSALAAERQAVPLLTSLLPWLKTAGVSLGPLCIVRHARVAIQDEIGARLGARQSLILLGERPGLGTPDSLGAYLTYGPRPGRTDADRNCVSNIRPGGLHPTLAAKRLGSLLVSSQRMKLSGIALKEDDLPPSLSPG